MSHSELIKRWIQDLKGSNQNTYKFALQRAILLNSQTQKISMAQLGDAFVKLYWNNVVSFKLRETNNIKQLPQFHKSILEVAASLRIESMNYLHAKGLHKDLEQKVVNHLPKTIQEILANPISRLQHDYKCQAANGDPRGSGWLFEWDMNEGIRLHDKYYAALVELEFALNNLTVYGWAYFLERFNHTPALLQKLEDIKYPRTISGKIKEFIYQHVHKKCFYCEESIADVYDLDHFVPYAFLYDTPVWDIVLSCVKCNRGIGGKFDRLPTENFLTKLQAQNELLSKLEPERFKDFIGQNGQADFNERLNREYKACLNAGFSKWLVS